MVERNRGKLEYQGVVRRAPNEHPIPSEKRDVQQTLLPVITANLPLLERISSYNHLVRVTAWVLRFVNNGRKRSEGDSSPILSLSELKRSEEIWWRIVQKTLFEEEICNLENGKGLSTRSKILPFHPFLDERGLLCIGERLQRERLPSGERHPVLLPGNHKIIGLLITVEHLRLMHAGPTLVSASLSHRFTVLGGRWIICTIASRCVTCRKVAAKPAP